MTATSDQPDPGYTVELTGSARAQLQTVTRHAIYTGRGEQVVAAVEEIFGRLRTEPREFGEPLYHFRRMRMDVRNATVRPVYVEYGVHETEPLVVVRYVAPLADPAS